MRRPISTREHIRTLCPGRFRLMALFKFYCDESYDSDPHQDESRLFDPTAKPHVPQTFAVAGFIAPENVWERVERRWNNANRFFKVSRFHAANVNARDGEYEGWKKGKRNRYVRRLLRILTDQRLQLHAFACGMFARDYERIISEKGRENFGPPYIACFKSCVSMLAQQMELGGFPEEDKFSVVLDRNEWELEAVKIFYDLKDTTEWPFHSRLETCAPGSSAEIAALQTADLITYDTFKLLHGKHRGIENVCRSLESMFGRNGFYGVYFEQDTLNRIKEAAENSSCLRGKFVVNFPPPDTTEAAEKYRRQVSEWRERAKKR